LYRPKHFIQKNGKRKLSPLYKNYLFAHLKMTADERSQWANLGVNVTQAREKRLVDIYNIYDFIEQPCGEQ